MNSGNLLESHIRKEERKLFPEIEKILSEKRIRTSCQLNLHSKFKPFIHFNIHSFSSFLCSLPKLKLISFDSVILNFPNNFLMIAYIILGATYAFAAAVQPGQFQTFIISQTLKNGWKKTLPAAFAPILSDGPIIVLVLFILTNVPTGFLQVLQICGGLLLLYLAYKSFEAFRQYDANKKPVNDKSDKTLLKAVVVNAINPAPYIGWSLIMGPLFLKGYNEAPANGISLLSVFTVF